MPLDKHRIIDPVLRIKLKLDESENQRIAAIAADIDNGGVQLVKASKQSSNRVEREIQSVEKSAFNPMEAISKVLSDAKNSHKLNHNVTQKVSLMDGLTR
jgi:hypothetical protein